MKTGTLTSIVKKLGTAVGITGHEGLQFSNRETGETIITCKLEASIMDAERDELDEYRLIKILLARLQSRLFFIFDEDRMIDSCKRELNG